MRGMKKSMKSKPAKAKKMNDAKRKTGVAKSAKRGMKKK